MLILPYRDSWANDFCLIKEVIIGELDKVNVEIEHIGSTAIPGCAAKPIIDIDLVYYQPEDFPIIKEGLEVLGYYHNGNQGITQREVFKRRKNTYHHNVLDVIDHHLYVCPVESAELKRHIIFRDYLKSHKSTRKKYENLKLVIAEKAHQDRKVYALLKEKMALTFIEEVMKKAKG